MIVVKEEPIPRATVARITNWFSQVEADLVKQMALDLQTINEVAAVAEAGKYLPGQQGFTVTEKAKWAAAQRYKIFLEVFEELEADRDPVSVTISHHHAN